MGHSWREMDPAGARRHDERISREQRIRKELENVPLSEFTVSELPALLRLVGVRPSLGIEARSEDFDLLEKKIKKM